MWVFGGSESLWSCRFSKEFLILKCLRQMTKVWPTLSIISYEMSAEIQRNRMFHYSHSSSFEVKLFYLCKAMSTLCVIKALWQKANCSIFYIDSGVYGLYRLHRQRSTFYFHNNYIELASFFYNYSCPDYLQSEWAAVQPKINLNWKGGKIKEAMMNNIFPLVWIDTDSHRGIRCCIREAVKRKNKLKEQKRLKVIFQK